MEVRPTRPRVPVLGSLSPCESALRRRCRGRMMAASAGPTGGHKGWRTCLVEMAIGIALVVISGLLIYSIVRVVSANLNIGR